MGSISQDQLLREGFAALSKILSEGPGAALGKYFDTGQPDHGYDGFWQADGVTILVEAVSRFTPRTMDHLNSALSSARLQKMSDPVVLILAPWLSPRSRDLIADKGWSYLDLTGNVLVRSNKPTIYVRLAGADVDPQPRTRNDVLLRGAGINALIRLLVDVEPPYRLSALAESSGLSKGYVSRALTALHERGLVERRDSGPIEHVDWPGLLRQRAAEYDLFGSNRAQTYLARSGAPALFQALTGNSDVTVTGSFAAARINPVAAPAQLALYVASIRDFARQHELFATTSGANVLLLEPSSLSQLDRPRLIDGVQQAGYSQLVQDLLAGNGRLPEEGEAVLQWMIDTPGWRLTSLPARGE